VALVDRRRFAALAVLVSAVCGLALVLCVRRGSRSTKRPSVVTATVTAPQRTTASSLAI
jgi:hypothetical protein